MKIQFLLTYYRPHWTGLTQYAARLAEGLAAKRHTINVLCVQHDRRLPRNEIIKGVKVEREPYLFKFSRTLIAPFLLFRLCLNLISNDVVVIYLPFLEVLPAVFFIKLFRKKVYLIHNGDLVLPKTDGFIARFTEKLFFIFTSASIKYSDGIIVQTTDYAINSKLLSSYKNKWRVVLPLYETNKISKIKLADFKKKYGLGNKKIIGFSGRFVEEKGVDFLLDAVSGVVEKIPNAHFIFAGDYKISYEKFWDKIKQKVKANAKDITLLGLIKNNEDLACFYKSLDVLVQPSRSDCFPSSLVEAILYGVPAVCTDIPGARWIVNTSGMGIVVKPQNSDALVTGIVEILTHREKYLKPSKTIQSVFSYTNTLNEYEKLFSHK